MARLHARAARNEMFWLLAALTQPDGEDMSLRDAAGGVGNAQISAIILENALG